MIGTHLAERGKSSPRMTTLEGQIVEAVGSALSGSAATAEATSFLDQVKGAPSETWSTCLDLYLNGGQSQGQVNAHAGETCLFALQVLTEANEHLDMNSKLFIKTKFLYHIKDRVGAEEPLYLRKAAAHYAGDLFSSLVTQDPAADADISATSDFMDIFFQCAYGPAGLNAAGCETALRFLHELSTEISDVQVRLSKSPAQLRHDGWVRDVLRVRDVGGIASFTWYVIRETWQIAEYASLCILALKVVACLVSWIDINLTVTPESIQLVKSCLACDNAEIQGCAADVLSELVSKGMSPEDKLTLLNALDLVQSFGIAINEHFTHLLACYTLELVKVLDFSQTLAAQAKHTLESIEPYLLSYLRDPSSAPQILPSIQALLNFWKKEHRRGSAERPKSSFLADLVVVSLTGVAYAEDHDWTPRLDPADDDAVLIDEKRRKFLLLIASLVTLDPETCIPVVSQSIQSVWVSETIWSRIEASLQVLYATGSHLVEGNDHASGVYMFALVPPELTKQKLKPAEAKLDYAQFPQSSLGFLLSSLIQAPFFSSGDIHPSIVMILQEIYFRYADFFFAHPDLAAPMTHTFVERATLPQIAACPPLCRRATQLISRFAQHLRSILKQRLDAQQVSQELELLAPLFSDTSVVSPDSEEVAQVAIVRSGADDSALVAAIGNSDVYNAHQHAFEAAGVLISLVTQGKQRSSFVEALLTPLLAMLSHTSQPNCDVIRFHQAISAVGSLAQGFPDVKDPSPEYAEDSSPVFYLLKEAVTSIIANTDPDVARFSVIQAAIRFTFSCVIMSTGIAALPVTSIWVAFSIQYITDEDLADFVNTLLLIVAKFKAHIFDIMDELYPIIVARVFRVFSSENKGTDDTLTERQVAKSYLLFLSALTCEELAGVFISARNMDKFASVLQSLVHLVSDESVSTPSEKKTSVHVLYEFITRFTADPATQSPGPTLALDLTSFMLAEALPVIFRVTLNPALSIQDALSVQLLQESGVFLRVAYSRFGDAFLSVLATTIFPQYSLPQDLGQELVQGFALDMRQYRKFAHQWFLAARQKQTA